jgi:ribonuclease HI
MDISADDEGALLIEVYFDGLCQPINPGGIACYAFIVRREGHVIHSDYGVAVEPFSRHATNNVAEYTALIKSLEWLLATNLNSDRIEIKSDSQLVVKQLSGNYKVKAKRIIPLYQKALLLKSKFKELEIKWVAREQNKEADALTNKAYLKTLQDNSEYLDRSLQG